MRKYKTVEIQETQLEELVRRSPETIEPGLRYLDHQQRTDRGRLDVLFVDSGKALVVAELKVDEDDNMLMQGLDYYDYITQDLGAFAKAYGQSSSITIDTAQPARLFLIAPSFSVTLLNRCKWIKVPISLFRFKCIAFEDKPDDTIIIFDEATIPSRPEPIEIPTIDQHLGYITDENVRNSVKTLLDEIKAWDPDRIILDAIKYEISLKVDGRVFAYLGPRREHFVIHTYDRDGEWRGIPIKSDDDVRDIKILLKRSYEDLKQPLTT